MPNNRGACCHVAGDIDFDSHNNLWLVTGDDTPAGGGNSGGFAPFNDMLTNESQTVARGQRHRWDVHADLRRADHRPDRVPARQHAIESALEALSNIDDVAVTGTGTRTVNFRGNTSQQNVPLMTADGSGLTGTSPTVTVAMATVTAARASTFRPRAGSSTLRTWTRDGLPRTPTTSAARSCGSASRRVTSRPPKRTRSAAPTPSQPGTSSPGTARTRAEIYAMGFRNPFRITLDKNDVAYVTDYSPDSQVPRYFRGPPARVASRSCASQPTTDGRCAIKTDLPYYQWDFNTSTPLPSAAAPEIARVRQPRRAGPQNSSRWVPNGGPTVDPGREYGPAITQPEIWYSYRDNQAAPNGPQGTPCFAQYGPARPASPLGACPQLFPELFTGGVGPTAPRRTTTTRQPQRDEVPAVLRRCVHHRRVHPGHHAGGPARRERTESSRSTTSLPCGAAPATPTRPLLCDNPMDMEFGPDGTFTCSPTVTASSPSTRTPAMSASSTSRACGRRSCDLRDADRADMRR